MIINAIYDSSVSSAPAGYKAAVSAAIQFLDATFTNNVTINVHFGWGEVAGTALDANAAGENITDGAFYTYSQLRNGLLSNATSAADLASEHSLPTMDPTGGGRFWLTDAEASALHLTNAPDIEASVALSDRLAYTFDPNQRAVSGEYDAVGTIEHELTEVMGRVGYLGKYFDSSVSNDYGPMDLFRYSSPGVRDFTGNGYFSPDGTTLLTKFNDPRNGGDVADWLPSVKGDAFGDAYLGQSDIVSATDLKVMDVLGYTLAGQTSTTSQVFVSTSANETFTGGPAIDTVVYSGNRAQYTVTDVSSVITVADSVAGRDGTDTLQNIEQVKFSDVTLVFDLQSSQDKLVYLLYQAAYAREPDLGGFRYWAGLADTSNESALQIADSFLAAPEFAAKYGTPNNQTFVTELYTNVLGRTPDSSGLAYWTGEANSGTARDQLLVSFATSNENVQLTATHTSDGFWVT